MHTSLIGILYCAYLILTPALPVSLHHLHVVRFRDHVLRGWCGVLVHGGGIWEGSRETIRHPSHHGLKGWGHEYPRRHWKPSHWIRYSTIGGCEEKHDNAVPVKSVGRRRGYPWKMWNTYSAKRSGYSATNPNRLVKCLWEIQLDSLIAVVSSWSSDDMDPSCNINMDQPVSMETDVAYYSFVMWRN